MSDDTPLSPESQKKLEDGIQDAKEGRIVPERVPAMVAPTVTVAEFKAQLDKSKSEFGILTNVRGDVGLVFKALLLEQKDDESPRMVHLTFAAARDLERMLRQTIKRIQK